jgi:hypothetical protein
MIKNVVLTGQNTADACVLDDIDVDLGGGRGVEVQCAGTDLHRADAVTSRTSSTAPYTRSEASDDVVRSALLCVCVC